MSTDTILGCIFLAGSLCLITGFFAWSIRAINRIAKSGAGPAREIMRKTNGDE